MTEKDYLKQIDYVIESGPYTDSWQTIFYKGIMPSETGFRFSSGL